jgi:hypothetical protein
VIDFSAEDAKGAEKDRVKEIAMGDAYYLFVSIVLAACCISAFRLRNKQPSEWYFRFTKRYYFDYDPEPLWLIAVMGAMLSGCLAVFSFLAFLGVR